MMTLRVLGLACMDQTALENQRRFGPWLTGALIVLLVTGLLMVVGEPERELVTFSFWAKMALVAVMTVIARRPSSSGVSRHDTGWNRAPVRRRAFRIAGPAHLRDLGLIIFLGRFIAYDHVWGHLSPATKA